MHASPDNLSVETIGDVYEGRFADLGDFTGYFEKIKGGTDFSPLFVGLPDDSCQCPHWGYLFKGKMRFIYKNHDDHLCGRGLLRAARPQDRVPGGHGDGGVLAYT